jgi:hypothetical protein
VNQVMPQRGFPARVQICGNGVEASSEVRLGKKKKKRSKNRYLLKKVINLPNKNHDIAQFWANMFEGFLLVVKDRLSLKRKAKARHPRKKDTLIAIIKSFFLNRIKMFLFFFLAKTF